MAWLADLQREFRDREMMKQYFPILTHFGVADQDITIHSHMLSYLVCIGLQLGFSAVAECPLPPSRDPRIASLGEVRADVLWFDRTNNRPIAAFEFERYQTKNDETQLRWKVENLAITAMRANGALKHTFLVYWLRSGKSPRSLGEPRASYASGFVRNGVRVPASSCPLTVAKCVFSAEGDGLVVSDILIVELG